MERVRIDLRELNRHTSNALRDTFTPLCLSFADAIRGMNQDELRSKLRGTDNKVLGAYLDVSTSGHTEAARVWEYEGEGGPLGRIVLIDPEALTRNAEEYRKYVEYLKGPDLSGNAERRDNLINSAMHEISAIEQLLSDVAAGTTLTFGDHRPSAERFAIRGTREQERYMEGITSNMRINAKTINGIQKVATERFIACYFAPVDIPFAEENRFLAYSIMAPIGEYGPAFSSRLLDTTVVMLRLAGSVSSAQAEDIKISNQALVHRTARNDPLDTLREGVISILHSVSLVLAKKIPGYGDPEAALSAVIGASLPAKLSSVAPAAFVGPLNLCGRFVPNMVQVDRNGNIRLSSNFIERIAGPAKLHRENVNDGQHRSDTAMTGLGCPVGRTDPVSGKKGLQEVADAFLHVHRKLHVQEDG